MVEAKLIGTNNQEMYKAVVFSEGDTKNGEIFRLNFNDSIGTSHSWDWRWVFSVKVLYENDTILSLQFKQKVVALPSGKHPLSNVFFNNFSSEFKTRISRIIEFKNNNKIPITDAYEAYIS